MWNGSFFCLAFICLRYGNNNNKKEQERASKTKQANTTDKKVYTVLWRAEEEWKMIRNYLYT